MTSKKFNKDVLISEVQSRPALWRADDKYFKRRDITCKLWNEISEICHISAADAKTKWKSLKDQFRREMQKVLPIRSKWQYFDMMQFTKPFVSTSSLDNLPKDDTDPDPYPDPDPDNELEASGEDVKINEKAIEDEDDHESSENDSEDKFSCHPSTSSVVCVNTLHETRPSSSSKRKFADVDDKLFQLEQKKILLLEKSLLQPENPDLQFFKSLVPFMNAFSPLEKLQVRIKIQEIVYEQYAKTEEATREPLLFLKQEQLSL